MFTLNSLRAWTRRRSGKRILTIYLVILVALFGGAFILGPWLGLMPGATGDPNRDVAQACAEFLTK